MGLGLEPGSWEVVLENGKVFLEVTFSSPGKVSGISPTDPAVSSPHSACKPAGSYLIAECAWGWAQEAEEPS